MRKLLIFSLLVITTISVYAQKRMDYRNRVVLTSVNDQNGTLEIIDNKYLLQFVDGKLKSRVILDFKQFMPGKAGGYVYSYYTPDSEDIERIQVYDLREVSSRKRYKEYNSSSEIAVAFWYREKYKKQDEEYFQVNASLREGNFKTPKKKYRELDEISFDQIDSWSKGLTFKLTENNKFSFLRQDKEDVLFLDYQGITKNNNDNIINYHYKNVSNILEGFNEVILSDLRLLTIKEKIDYYNVNEDFKLTLVDNGKKTEIFISITAGQFDLDYTKRYKNIDERLNSFVDAKELEIFKIPTEKNMFLFNKDGTDFIIYQDKNVVSKFSGFRFLSKKDYDGVELSFYIQDPDEYSITKISAEKISKKLRREFFGNSYDTQIIISKKDDPKTSSLKYPLQPITLIIF